MNNDLISRNEVKKEITNWFANERYYHPLDKPTNLSEVIAMTIVDKVPTITPDKIQAIMSDYFIYKCEPERPQGEWIYSQGSLKCSRCGYADNRNHKANSNYCSNCGVKMKKGGAE